jgi:hypothetical protein
MNAFDKVSQWVAFITDWVIYVANIFKAVNAGMATVRNSWPDKPVNPFSEGKGKAGTGAAGAGNTERPGASRNAGNVDTILDGGERVRNGGMEEQSVQGEQQPVLHNSAKLQKVS